MSLIDEKEERVTTALPPATEIWSLVDEAARGRKGHFWRRIAMTCLYVICEWNYVQIAKAFDSTPGTVWRSVRCAMKELRSILEDDDEMLRFLKLYCRYYEG